MFSLIKKMAIAVNALVLGIVICLSGCDTISVKPIEPGKSVEYYVYFCDYLAPSACYRYQTGTGILDSLPLPYDTWQAGLAVSPDGRTLYQNPPHRIVEISADSQVVVAEHTITITYRGDPGLGNSEIILSDDGQYMALINYYLHILNTSDYSVIYRDTTRWFKHGRFNKYGTDFVCTGEDSLTYSPFLMNINLVGTPDETIYPMGNWFPSRVVPNAPNDTWYILGQIYNDYWVYVVLDLDQDTILYTYEMCPGNGDLEVTPDGAYTIFSQPGSWIGTCTPPRYFTIFANISNTIHDTVNVFVDSLGVVIPRELCITPDGRHLIGVGEFLGFFDYNLNSRCVERYLIPYTAQMYHLICQSNP